MRPYLTALKLAAGLAVMAGGAARAQAQMMGWAGGYPGWGSGYQYPAGGWGTGTYGGMYAGGYGFGSGSLYGGGCGGYGYYDPYSGGSTFEYIGGPAYQTASHVRYFDNRTFRHHVFENVFDERVIHTGEYRRTRITGDVYTPSYQMARRMYQSGY